MLSSGLQPRPAVPGSEAAPPVGERLAVVLRDIVAGAAVPEDALEPTLRAILEVTGAAAGAVCFYDQRREVLRLAAEVGLSDEGCRRLRTVRRGEVTSWDMPLHSLSNRRVYLIESAARNRYVPPLVEQAAAVRTVACLPLFEGAAPVGSLVLISLAPHSLGELQVRTLELPLREVTRLIGAVRSRVNAPAPSVRPTTPPAAPVAVPPPAVVSAPAVPVEADAEAARLRAALAAAAGEGARLTAELERLGEAPGRAATLETALAAGESERAVLRTALEGARAELTEARELAGRHGEDAERLRTELERVQTETAATKDRLAQLAVEADAERAARAAAQTELAELRAAAGDHADGLIVAHREAECLRAEVVEAGAVRERLAAELTRHAAEAAAAEARERDLRHRLEEGREELEAVRAAAGGRADEAIAAHQGLERLRGEVERVAADRDAARAEGTRLGDELVALRCEVAAVSEARDQLVQALAGAVTAQEARVVEPEHAPQAPQPAEDPDAGVEAIELPLAEEEGPPAASVSTPAPAESGGIVVLDTDRAWEQLRHDGRALVVCAPEADAGARMAACAPERIVANLARAGALDAIAGLRAAGCTARVWGCLAGVAAGRALPLGVIEPTIRPLDPDAVLAAVGPYVTKGTRVVTVGNDVDALVSLRQALSRRGVSVSMAWDAKQAADLLAMVRPEVVILDLGLPLYEGYRILVRLGTANPVPATIVLPGADDAAGFAAALADPSLAHRLVPLERLVGDMLKKSAAAPERR